MSRRLYVRQELRRRTGRLCLHGSVDVGRRGDTLPLRQDQWPSSQCFATDLPLGCASRQVCHDEPAQPGDIRRRRPVGAPLRRERRLLSLRDGH